MILGGVSVVGPTELKYDLVPEEFTEPTVIILSASAGPPNVFTEAEPLLPAELQTIIPLCAAIVAAIEIGKVCPFISCHV